MNVEFLIVAERVHQNPALIFSVGTQVVTMRNITTEGGRILHPRGSVGVIIRSPGDLNHSYRVRFLDGIEEAVRREELMMLAQYKEGEIGDSQVTAQRNDLFARVIYRCIVGSRAYGLEGDESDTDYRGIYLPHAELHWSLYGVPDQIDREETQELYWELQRFLVLRSKQIPTYWNAFIRHWSKISRRWERNCSKSGRHFCREWSSRRTTAMSPHSSKKCSPTSAIKDK